MSIILQKKKKIWVTSNLIWYLIFRYATFIKVSEALSGKVRGLCGNGNGAGEDDWLMKTGEVTSSTAHLFDSWKVDGVTCNNLPYPMAIQNIALNLCKMTR